MKTSLTMINSAKILYATFLTALLVTLCTLQAMECPYKGGGQTAHSKKVITLQCSDSTIFEVPYEIIIQCTSIKLMLEHFGYGENTSENISVPIPIHPSISSSTLSFIIKCLTRAQDLAIETKKLSPFNSALELAQHCKNQTLETYFKCAVAANWLDYPLLLQTFCLLIEDMLNDHMHQQGLTVLNFFSNMSDYDVVSRIKLLHLINHNKQLIPHQPITVTFHDIINYGELEHRDSSDQSNLVSSIISLINTSQFDRLQHVLDILTKHATPLSIEAHEVVVAYVISLKKEQITELFKTLKDHGESTLKMALRLVYAKDHNLNFGGLDGLDCVYFFDNINKWVNGTGFYITPLFSQTYLQYVLPLIEPITGAPITMLDLYNNKLTSLPDSIGNLVNLEELRLYDNKLTSLPDSIGNLVNVTQLDLYNNELTSLPDSIGNLVNLEELRLYDNKLTSLPDSIGNLVKLKELFLWENKLTSLPDSIGNLVKLKELDLSDNKLTSLPDSIGKLVNVEELSLKNNKLTSLPDSIGSLVNMTKLYLSDNKLTSLPDTIGSLVNVKRLSLFRNQLNSLPDSIGTLVNLKRLDLSSNKLTSLPDTIGSLVNVKKIWLCFNQLTSLPDSIGKLSNLKELSLFNNKLTSLPDSTYNLSNVEKLTFCFNPLADEIKQALTNEFGHIKYFKI